MMRSQRFTISAQPLLKGPRRLSTGSLIVAAVVFCALDLQGYALAWTGEITANINSPGPTIPANFIGFSDEVSDVITDTIFTPGNASLIDLLKLLGPNGIWRIGGADSDLNPPPALTQQIANDAVAFISALGAGWSTIYGLDALIQDSTIAVTQAGYLLKAFPRGSIAFQVGNEPDFYFTHGINEAGWINIFNSYYSALTTTYSGLQFGGPDTAGLSNIGWVDGTILGRSGFAYITAHKYTLPCAPTSVTDDQVMADATVPSDAGVTLTEFGILCDGGQMGVTDRLIAATYYLKLAQSAFAAGMQGILPHNVLTPSLWGDGIHLAYYNQFVAQPDGGYAPAPMFYGMYLFAQLEGQTSISTIISSSLDNRASVNATLGPNGNANILVVNVNTTHEIAVEPEQSQPWSTANVYVLSGKNCEDPNPLLNGYAIGQGGTWPGSAAILVRSQHVSIPACGAALIEIQP
jgi:hypothetical protein